MVQLSMPCLHTHKIPLLQHRHSHCYSHSSNISICKHHLIGISRVQPLHLPPFKLLVPSQAHNNQAHKFTCSSTLNCKPSLLVLRTIAHSHQGRQQLRSDDQFIHRYHY
eukprot:jgi/Chrzof1/12147/Cz06g22270.t1